MSLLAEDVAIAAVDVSLKLAAVEACTLGP
jgi:hypothetical protein